MNIRGVRHRGLRRLIEEDHGPGIRQDLHAVIRLGASPRGGTMNLRKACRARAFLIARIGPLHPTRALDIKGPLADHRAGMRWTAFALGAALLLAAGGGWGRQWWRNRQRRSAPMPLPPTAAEEALQRLRQEETTCRPPVAPTLPAGPRLGCIVRQYLHAELGVPASALTTAELATHLHDTPLAQELLYVLEQCDALTYQPPSATQTEERDLWWTTLTLFEKLQKGHTP